LNRLLPGYPDAHDARPGAPRRSPDGTGACAAPR
jgi:hypothetical protein